MVRPINTLEEAAKLRRQAEELALRHSPTASANPESTLPDWVVAMVHELRVHQIELEMQNEELRRAQLKLEEANERYFDLYNLAPIGLFILNEAGVILDANLYAASRLGVPRIALVRQPFTRFIPREDQDDFYLHRRRITDTASTESWDLRLVRHDGTVFWAHLSAAADQDVVGSPVLRITIGDLSLQKNVENQQEILEVEHPTAKRIESLGEIAHEMNNVLGSILGMASAHVDTQPVGSSTHHAFETIMKAAERGATTSQKLASLAQQSIAERTVRGQNEGLPEAHGHREHPIPSAHQAEMAAPIEAFNMTNIRRAEISDIPGVVDVHLASFQNFFLTFLGRAFLVHLYQEVALEPNTVFLVATSSQNVVVGFAAGVPDLGAFYKRLARFKWLKFGLSSVRAAVRRPSILPRLWRALWASESASQASCPATLISIAVAPETKRMGIGKVLISRFLAEMESEGIQEVCLTTDRDKNASTLAFYEMLGFKRVREFRTKEGRWICEYFIHPHECTIDHESNDH